MSDRPHSPAAWRASPAAERNAEPILAVLRDVLPASGLVLEVASGTGQHVVRFAAALPHLTFQPSDREPQDEALATRVREAALPNLRAPILLDVTARPWPLAHADALVCVNMIHISPWVAAEALLEGAATTLSPGACLFLYGPFLREGVETAPGNLAFDASLKRRNPAWGLRTLEAVADEAERHGFDAPQVREMPANNLALVFRRAG